MRFAVDENMGPSVAGWLVARGHEVFSVYDEAPGMSDEGILEKANRENYIVVSCDKDFGELVYKKRMPHRGVLFFRLVDETPAAKIRLLEQACQNIPSCFLASLPLLQRGQSESFDYLEGY
jgi:predicted nuclease of predicted toxin-antitoxin system